MFAGRGTGRRVAVVAHAAPGRKSVMYIGIGAIVVIVIIVLVVLMLRR
jgi:hypothetical protein